MNLQNLNTALNILNNGGTTKQVERLYGTPIRKMVKILKEKYTKYPIKIGSTEFQILLGNLREKELNYRKRKKLFKKEQTKLSKFGLRF